MDNRVTIAGYGVVGAAIKDFFTDRKFSVALYDPPKGYSDPSVLVNTDIVFVAVPTPFNERGFDLSLVNSVMPLIARGRSVIIKSTVLPGTTDALQKSFPELRIFFSPEFLSEKTARRDFQRPTRQIVGYTKRSKDGARRILALLPDAPYKAIMRATEAETVKYMNNVFYTLKVTYANLIYDLCDALDINYDDVAAAATSNEPMMGVNHWDVLYGGYRGYGGKCLPKDVQSLISLGKQLKIDVSLLELVEKINARRAKRVRS